MNGIQEYLNQLQIDKETLKTNLINKGIEVLDTDTFTEMSTKVADIQSGSNLTEYFDNTINEGNSQVGGWMNAIKKMPLLELQNETFANLKYAYSYFKGEEIELGNMVFSGYNKTLERTFNSCNNIKQLDLSGWNINNVQNMNYTFYDCTNLEEITGIENLDTSNVTSMIATFSNCRKLSNINIKNWDFSKVTKLNSFLSGCESITNIDISNIPFLQITDISYLFQRCTNLKQIIGIENIDFEKASSSGLYARALFSQTGLEEIDVTNMKNLNRLTGFYEWFYLCPNLHTINFNIDASKVNASNSMYGLFWTFYDLPLLENLTFCTNYGAGFPTTLSTNSSNAKIDFSKSTLLTHNSLMDIINKLYDLTANGKNSQQLTLGETNIAKLTEEEISIATNKGWTIA